MYAEEDLVVPWSLIDTARVPGGGDEMRLLRRGAEFSIMLGTNPLMNSRLSGSEEALARLACERLRHRPQACVLIGGLGMGFTLRAALAQLGPQARIIVAELVPDVVRWARAPLAEIFEGSLDDPRVTVWEGDVGQLIRTGRSGYDAILLDVDNGPEGLTREVNDGLYGSAGLGAAHRALRPGGILAVWSTQPDRHFVERLRRTGFGVDEARVHAHGSRGPRHVVWLATRGRGGRPLAMREARRRRSRGPEQDRLLEGSGDRVRQRRVVACHAVHRGHAGEGGRGDPFLDRVLRERVIDDGAVARRGGTGLRPAEAGWRCGACRGRRAPGGGRRPASRRDGARSTQSP